MFYIFHGEDEFSRAEELAGLRGRLAGGDLTMAELNTTVLDGGGLTMGELRHVCDTIPFLADRRLVIVHNLLKRLASGGKAGSKDAARSEGVAEWKRSFEIELAAYLPNLPLTTRLIFLEDQALPSSHPILRLAQSEDRAFARQFALPKERELPGWILMRARAKGGSMSREAASMLADLVGTDLRMLDQEVEKLLVYADGRQVETEDVNTLVSRARETSIFDLVDCVGRRESDLALQLLHHLLDEGEPPLYLLAMLARQVRLLIQVSELRDQGLAQKEIAKRLKLHPYVVEKGLAQAQRFDMTQLEAAHRRVLDTDWSIKTGRSEDVLALDMLVVNLTRH